MKIFLFYFNGFTINESVLGSVPGEQRKWGLKLFGLVSPRGDFKFKTTLHGGLKLRVNTGPRQGSRMFGYHMKIKV